MAALAIPAALMLHTSCSKDDDIVDTPPTPTEDPTPAEPANPDPHAGHRAEGFWMCTAVGLCLAGVTLSVIALWVSKVRVADSLAHGRAALKTKN